MVFPAGGTVWLVDMAAPGRRGVPAPVRQPRRPAGRIGAGASIGGRPSTTAAAPSARYRCGMDPRTAWQAIGQRPWRSLAYLCCGFAPSALVAAGLIALVTAPSSELAPVVVPLVVLALLLSG